ncbi:hypothetical protein [Roseicyclus marinus]|uniref:hypothetical protein n=1 Tax=Roseicyclus marinus TaxID=2161673 RepID=UPI00240F7F39|nr:hypothetical protein [Roseicyclus marinus]MDG3042729.1 hypothetical protein [Roseicyclus marinus]
MSRATKWTRAFAVMAGLAPGPSAGQSGEAPDLAAILVGHDIIYVGAAWERHVASGRLVLRSLEGPSGVTSLGEWRVEDGARCLRWNPMMDWECYAVALDGSGGITFTDGFGNAVTGRLVPR